MNGRGNLQIKVNVKKYVTFKCHSQNNFTINIIVLISVVVVVVVIIINIIIIIITG